MPTQGVLALAGSAAAAGIAAAAWRFGALTARGAVAATIVGTCAMAAGWEWGVVLVAFFVTSSALSRLGHPLKLRISAGYMAKTGARDTWQVLANGGVFGIAAVGFALSDDPLAGVAALGALAVANGDTWATEIGVLLGGTPRSIVTWRRLAPGTSGAVSLIGTLSGIAGILLIAACAAILHIDQDSMSAILAGGAAGLTADSILGATIQSQRWCEQCRSYTERDVHTCGTRTVHRRGIRLLTNDGVNAAATVVGAAVAALAA